MQKLKPLKLAHVDLEESLYEWKQAKKRFEDENAWPKGRHAPYDILYGRIFEAADDIHTHVRVISDTLAAVEMYERVNLVLVQVEYSRTIRHASIEMRQAVEDGTDAMLDYCENPKVFVSWQAVCGGVESFARSAAQKLADLQSKYPGVSDRSLVPAVRSLEATAKVAMNSRKSGISGYLQGPLSEYALEDARLLGLSTNKDDRIWRI